MLYDITPPISEHLAVWPGDTPISREVLMAIAEGDSIELSTMRATVHLGAHADAPSHYGDGAATIEARSLEHYLGRCQVVTAQVDRGSRVTSSDLAQPITETRVVIRTSTYPDATSFNEDFAGLDPELVDAMHGLGVITVGIDTPSVDLFSDKTLQAHHRFLSHDIAILEGLVLTEVPDGVYELIAIPLPLVGFDASPVRALLRTLADA
jgi:arylformamidase